MKDSLSYFKIAHTHAALDPKTFKHKVTIRLITNFTDAPLQKILVGMCLDEGLYPTVIAAPYKQYHLYLKQPETAAVDITFILFDGNNYAHSAFHQDTAHFEETLADIERYCAAQKGPVVVSLFPVPYQSAYGNLFEKSPFYQQVEEANRRLHALASQMPNLYLCDTNHLLHAFGERAARDFRGLYSADIPFTNDFFVHIAREWVGLVRASLGLAKKCLVLDLDNTLWGGVVGELGPTGIELGPEYPGLAYQNFQRAVLQLYNRGIILAINSRNNPGDVDEVFAKNTHMILRPEHFAAVRINWEDKVHNIRSLAEELNIGTDSMVFIDDDPMNRDLVRTLLPEVATPEWSMPPEEFTTALFSLTYFHQFVLTEEDASKGAMYAQERQRKVVQTHTQTVDEYIAALVIQLKVHINDQALMPRLSQMTLKTNQFNLTTKRYGEKELHAFMTAGNLVCAADVSDKFGEYGTTVLAIVVLDGARALLDSFLMSCRVMGRGVEYAYMHALVRLLDKKGVTEMAAHFIPTPKNTPAKDFLATFGFTECDGSYVLSVAEHLAHPPACIKNTIAVDMAIEYPKMQ